MSFFQVGLSPSSFIKGDFTAGTIVTLRRSYSICYFPASAWLKQRDKKESLLESAHNLHWTCCRLFCSTSCDRLSSFPGIVLRLPLSLSLSLWRHFIDRRRVCMQKMQWACVVSTFIPRDDIAYSLVWLSRERRRSPSLFLWRQTSYWWGQEIREGPLFLVRLQ